MQNVNIDIYGVTKYGGLFDAVNNADISSVFSENDDM